MPVPTKLYKYRNVSDRTEDIIVNNCVFFSEPHTLNDPFDCKMPLDFTGSASDYEDLVRKISPGFSSKPASINALAATITPGKRRMMLTMIRDKYARILSHDCSIFCVAEHCDDILMFAHYADSHRGCCLEFDFSKDPLLKLSAKVTYQADYPDLNYFRLHGRLKDMGERLFLTKASQWSYEREWRMFRYKKPEGKHAFAPECLTGIVFGTEMPDADKRKIRGWVAKRGRPVQFYQAAVSRTRFALEIKPIK